MTLRDYFAGQALAGLLSDPNESGDVEDFAERAYRLADAMIEARDRSPNPPTVEAHVISGPDVWDLARGIQVAAQEVADSHGGPVASAFRKFATTQLVEGDK